MRPVFDWLIGARTLQLGKRTLIMGVVNVTPDSFSDGGVNLDPDRALAFALKLLQGGANIIDVPWSNPSANIPNHLSQANVGFLRQYGGRLEHIICNQAMWNNVINNDFVAAQAGIADDLDQIVACALAADTGLEQVIAAVTIGEEGDPLAVRRPGRLTRVVEDVRDACGRPPRGRQLQLPRRRLRRVPAIDRSVILHSRIAALMRRFRYLAQQVLRDVAFHRLAVRHVGAEQHGQFDVRLLRNPSHALKRGTPTRTPRA